jgi:hypothetical protein
MPHIPKRAVQPDPEPSPVSSTEGVRRELLATQPRKKLEVKQIEKPVRKASQMIDRVSPWKYDVDPDEVMDALFPNGIKAGQ